MSNLNNPNDCIDLQQDDEKKNKKKQSPVDDRPQVPSPSEAMLKSKLFSQKYLHSDFIVFFRRQDYFINFKKDNIHWF